MVRIVTTRKKSGKFFGKSRVEKELIATVYVREKGANGGIRARPDGKKHKLRRDKGVKGWKVAVTAGDEKDAIMRKKSKKAFLIRIRDRLFLVKQRDPVDGAVRLSVFEREGVEEEEAEEQEADMVDDSEDEYGDNEEDHHGVQGEDESEDEEEEEEEADDKEPPFDETADDYGEDLVEETGNVKPKHKVGSITAHSESNKAFTAELDDDLPELLPHLGTWIAFFLTRRQNKGSEKK